MIITAPLYDPPAPYHDSPREIAVAVITLGIFAAVWVVRAPFKAFIWVADLAC